MKRVSLSLVLGLGLWAVGHGLQASAQPPPAQKKFTAAKIPKQATQLKLESSSSSSSLAAPKPGIGGLVVAAQPTVSVGITLRLTHTIQFSSDLLAWTNVVQIPEPPIWTNLPAPGQRGFYRDVTGNTYDPASIVVSTNAPTP